MLAFRLTGCRIPGCLCICIVLEHTSRKCSSDRKGFRCISSSCRAAAGELKIPGKGSWPVGAGQLWVGEPGVAHEFHPHSRTNGELGYIGIGGSSAGSVLQSAGLLHEDREPYPISNSSGREWRTSGMGWTMGSLVSGIRHLSSTSSFWTSPGPYRRRREQIYLKRVVSL